MDHSEPTRVRWLLVLWISGMGAVSYLDRVNISIAGRSIERDFHLTNPELGAVFSAFAIGYALFQIPGGWMADRFGPRRILALGALWWTAFTAFTGSVPAGIGEALLVLWLVRFSLGVGESVMYPSSNRWLAAWIPRAERGAANGVIFAGVGAGAAFAPPLVAAVMARYGWRVSFQVCALAGVVSSVAWYWLARDAPRNHPWVSASERKFIEAGIADKGQSETSRLPWSVLFSSRDVWSITFSYFCYGYAAYIFFTWFFIYLTTVRGLNLKSGAFYTMLPFIAMSSCSALGGLLSDHVSKRWGRYAGRCGVAAGGLGGCTLFLAFGSIAHSAVTASLILAGGAGALYIAQSSYWALAADLGGASAGSLSGLINMGAQFGSAITATLTPVIAAHLGWTVSFLIAAALCALGAVAWLMVNPNRTLTANARVG